MKSQDMARGPWLSAVLILSLTLSLGCSELASSWPSTPQPTAAGRPSPRPTVALPTPTHVPLAADVPITLTLWTAAGFAQTDDAIAQSLQDFEAEPPQVRVVTHFKGMQGKGGLVDLLTATAPVAPSLLPDLAIVDATQANSLAQRGLIHPWSELLPPNLEEDFLPLADQLGYYQGQRIGVPLALDVQHLAYSREDVTTRPLLWRDVITGKALYLFPALGRGEALDAFLIHYLGAGGRLLHEEGTPLLEQEPLVAALGRYEGVAIAGVLPPETLQLSSLADCWPLFLSGQVSVVHTWASHYLAGQSGRQQTSFAPIPSGDRMVTLGRGWLIVLVTEDPARRESAARLMSWWLSAEHSADFCQAAGWLPPTHMAFDQWQGDGRYYTFLQGQLEAAIPQPVLPAAWAEALSAAIGHVLRRELTSQEAAAQVMDIVGPR